jgi:hypothetical protein
VGGRLGREREFDVGFWEGVCFDGRGTIAFYRNARSQVTGNPLWRAWDFSFFTADARCYRFQAFQLWRA